MHANTMDQRGRRRAVAVAVPTCRLRPLQSSGACCNATARWPPRLSTAIADSVELHIEKCISSRSVRQKSNLFRFIRQPLLCTAWYVFFFHFRRVIFDFSSVTLDASLGILHFDARIYHRQIRFRSDTNVNIWQTSSSSGRMCETSTKQDLLTRCRGAVGEVSTRAVRFLTLCVSYFFRSESVGKSLAPRISEPADPITFNKNLSKHVLTRANE